MMKKTFFKLSVIFSILIASVFTSCDLITFSIPKNKNITQPAVYADATGIHITPTLVSNIDYLNIYRIECTGDTLDATQVDGSIVNICQLKPVYADDDTDKSDTPTMTFHDVNVNPTKFYQYMVRYKFETGYKNSDTSAVWSAAKCTGSAIQGEMQIVNVSTDSPKAIAVQYDTGTYYMTVPMKNMKVEITGSSETSDKKIRITSDNNLTLSTAEDEDDITDEEKFNVYMAISNGTLTYLFKMNPITLNSDDYLQIALRSCIPEGFYDTTLKLKGFVTEYSENLGQGSATDGSSSSTYTARVWSKPMVFNDSENQADENRNFYIYDVLAEDEYKDIDDTFEVVSSTKASNLGDYTPLTD